VADRKAAKVNKMSEELEDRVKSLVSVETQLSEFEGRLTNWEHVDQEINRTLEQISARQNTIESLKADIDRMFVTAEKTAENVRAITSAHRDVEEGRKLLEDVMSRLREVRNAASAIDDRKRQLTRSEERLARADALLVDVNTGLSTLHAQKIVVDQAVERVGSLRFLLKQAEGMIEGLRDERKMTVDVLASVLEIDPGEETEDHTTDDESENKRDHSEAA
jgi:DNA repair exonuclease SbcCD ATPase subunit